MPMQVQVIAHKSSSVTFTITINEKDETENAIAERLHSDTELVWKDDPEGVKVDCLYQNRVWRPRRRFALSKDSGGEE